MPSEFLLRIHVEAMVPLRIYDYLRCPGGIDPQRVEYARNVLAWDLAEHGDALLYYEKTKKPKSAKQAKKTEQSNSIGTAEMMNKLVDGLAILSFCPGGINFLGLHFEAAEIAKRLGIALEPEESMLEPIKSEERTEAYEQAV